MTQQNLYHFTESAANAAHKAGAVFSNIVLTRMSMSYSSNYQVSVFANTKLDPTPKNLNDS